MRAFPIASVLLCLAGVIAPPARAALSVSVAVVEPNKHPVPGVRVELRTGASEVAAASTDASGRAEFKGVEPGRYEIVAAKEGYLTLRKSDLDLEPGGPATIELTLVPATAAQASVEVKAEAAAVEMGPSTPSAAVSGLTVKDLPTRPATVTDALPLIPGVARQPGGGLQISGSGEHRSSLIVNSADVTDPATGQFGLTVPMDSVDTMDVYQAPFLAEYGRFSAGVVSVATRRGSDQWKWELNDPLPEFFIRSWHLRGLRDATPRLNLGGPLLPGKLYFSEGVEYEIRKTPVFTLPFPRNLKRRQGFNSFAQLDWVISPTHLVTGTVHIAPQRLGNVNIDYYNPQPTTPDAATHNYTGTLADKLTLGGSLLESTFSVTKFYARVWSQGLQDLAIAPGGNSGNYFAEQARDASRFSGRSEYSFAPHRLAGSHSFKIGGYFARSSENGQVTEGPINIFDSSGLLLQTIAFTSGQPFRMNDTEIAIFGQDHWIISPVLSMDAGIRTESQAVSEAFRVAPRGGIAWSPFPGLGTVVRAGFGLFFDRVPLSVYSFSSYPDRIVTFYNPDGSISSGPIFYLNGLGQVERPRRFVFLEHGPGDFAPRSTTWSAQIEQPLSRRLKVRASYMSTLSDGLVILDRSAPDPVTNTGSDLLSGTGQARYRQLELTARVGMGEGRQLFFSYVDSRARGDLNDFANFLGTFPIPIIRPNQFGNLPTNLPHRFLAWGTAQLPRGFLIAPTIEYRSGFPYSTLDELQRYVGTPYANRFPAFFSADARLSRKFKVNPKYSVRLSVSSFNLTNHFNPEAVHWNTGDSAYGLFFGQRGRHFTLDFDFLF
ncbi:MAG: carboxypeptidase regulatory-like domain-containing protein [Bryobacteraceae bacterium]